MLITACNIANLSKFLNLPLIATQEILLCFGSAGISGLRHLPAQRCKYSLKNKTPTQALETKGH